MNEKDALSNQLIRVKYGEDRGGWSTKVVRAGYGVGVWKMIKKEWNVAAGNLAFEVGDEGMANFWKENWCGSMPL